MDAYVHLLSHHTFPVINQPATVVYDYTCTYACEIFVQNLCNYIEMIYVMCGFTLFGLLSIANECFKVSRSFVGLHIGYKSIILLY